MRPSGIGLVLVVLVTGGLGYLRLPTSAAPPKIEQFAVSHTGVMVGQPVDFSWQLGENASAQLLSVGAEVRLTESPYRTTPTLSGLYTLVAQNRVGSVQETRLVQVDAPPSSSEGGASGGAAGDAGLPEGGLGVSLDPSGPFVSDEASGILGPDDERVLRVTPGGEFFAEVYYTDPDGIAEVSLYLANGRPEGLSGTLLPDQPPFEIIGAPTGDCRLGRLPTAVRCVFRVRAAEDALNISLLPGAGDEFAYVFRSRASDGQGNLANREVRGYVVVTE